MVPPQEWTARKKGYKDLDLIVKSINNAHLISIIEPIEQNVNGNKGVYELVYIVKESKSL